MVILSPSSDPFACLQPVQRLYELLRVLFRHDCSGSSS